jgi:putative serine protease PepD
MSADNSHPPAPVWPPPQDNHLSAAPPIPPAEPASAAPPAQTAWQPPVYGRAAAPPVPPHAATAPVRSHPAAAPVPPYTAAAEPSHTARAQVQSYLAAAPVQPHVAAPVSSHLAAAPVPSHVDAGTPVPPQAPVAPVPGSHAAAAPVPGPGHAAVPSFAGPSVSGVPLGSASAVPLVSGTARGRRGRVVGVAVVAVLAVVVVAEGAWALQLSSRLGAAERALDADRAADGGRLGALEGRTDALEERVGSAFDAQAIAAATVPSVFRVAAGPVTGTAWAVVITNFHVVEDVYDDGRRQVFLEREDARWPATIVKVDKDNDLAQLTSKAAFDGLATATDGVQTGQQVAVVGAPLGLTDSVTTGVVSAMRPMDDSPGPLIQFSAPINPGNSGGPVINSAKQVVGVATAKAQDAEGIGLAVPVEVVCRLFPVC